jgi:peptidoglycan/LPS O-acetylase OafA/YrhL
MIFDAYSPIYLVLVATVTFLTSYVLDKIFGTPSVQHRDSALDGLRGFLVLGVFSHHAAFWISRKDGGRWGAPDGALAQLGPVYVILFFMITAFLYYGKLLRSRGKKVDWLQIALSRILRLAPLCIIMAIAAFGIALYTKNFIIVDDTTTLIRTFGSWASVGLGGNPDINGLKGSWEINAGVMWTLKYEWLFYVALPFFGIFALTAVNPRALIISGILTTLLIQIISASELRPIAAFLGGVVAVYAGGNSRLAKMCRGPVAALVFLAFVSNTLFSHRNAYGLISLVLLTVAFVIVACGNNIFGILSLRSVRSFGEVSYSAYLLHGLLLYLAFHKEKAVIFNPAVAPFQHWSIVSGLAIALVVICRLTYKYVELPGMNAVPFVYARIKKLTRPIGNLSTQP